MEQFSPSPTPNRTTFRPAAPPTAPRSAVRYRQSRSPEAVSRAFRALGHPHRLKIVQALIGRAVACRTSERADDCVSDGASCNVSELATFVRIAPSTLSHHLKELQDAGVIERSREGRYLYCRVNEELLADLAALLGGRARERERIAR